MITGSLLMFSRGPCPNILDGVEMGSHAHRQEYEGKRQFPPPLCILTTDNEYATSFAWNFVEKLQTTSADLCQFTTNRGVVFCCKIQETHSEVSHKQQGSSSASLLFGGNIKWRRQLRHKSRQCSESSQDANQLSSRLLQLPISSHQAPQLDTTKSETASSGDRKTKWRDTSSCRAEGIMST